MLRRILAASLLLSALAFPGAQSHSAGLVKGTYTFNWTQDVQDSKEFSDKRTMKHALDTKYAGFLSPVIENEITLKIEYDKGSDKASEVKIYPTIKLDYKGSYWNAGTKRSIERKPFENQKVTDAYYVELYYEPPTFGMPDLKAKYTADFDFQSATTDKLKQGVTVSSNYRPLEWLEIKGDYTRNTDEERFKKEPPDASATPVIKDDKYSFTLGVRHFFSEKLKFSSEWKSEFSRAASFFDNGVAKSDSIKEDQAHTWKNSLAFRPFPETQVDFSWDYDLKQTFVAKDGAGGNRFQDHTIGVTGKASLAQKIGKYFDIKGDFSRVQTDIRHSQAPSAKTDDGWNTELKADFAKQLQFNFKYSRRQVNEVFADPLKVPSETLAVVRSAGWNGELFPFWKAAATYDRTDTHNFTFPERGGFHLATIETKYGLKGPFDFKVLELMIDPSYDILIKQDFSKADPALHETIATRDFKVKVTKLLLATRTVDFKIDHSYGRKVESGHLDTTLNNITRTDSSSANITVKDVLPNLNTGFDFARSATDTSGDAEAADVTENFNLKADYKYRQLGWNANYKYDRNLRSDKDNKWTVEAKATWTAPSWDVGLSYTQSKTLSLLLDESYKVGVDFKYNF